MRLTNALRKECAMKIRHRLNVYIMCAVLAAGAALFSQGMAWQHSDPGGAKREMREQKEHELREAAERHHHSMEVGEVFEHFGDKQIKGAPFSAQVIIEETQTLANGSH